MNLCFYVLGDFNLRDQYIRLLLTTLKRMNLNQLIDVPTRNDKLLDLIIVNDFSKIMFLNVYDASIADHMLIECQINVRIPQPMSRQIRFRAFNKINLEMLLADLENVNIPTSNPSESLDYLLGSIQSVFNLHAPFVPKVIRDRHVKKFVSHDTKSLIKERDSLASYVVLHPNDLSAKLNLHNLRIPIPYENLMNT